MLKKFILFFALMVSLFGSAQDKPLSYSEVIQVEGKNQAEIYGGLRQWVATAFVNGKAVTQMEDATTGTLILRKHQLKDGRFRVEMSGLTHENDPGNAPDCSLGLITTAEKSGKGGINKGAHNKIWREIKNKSAEHFAEIVTSLKSLDNFNAEAEEDW